MAPQATPKTTAGIVGLVCGGELVLALLIGGAGIGSLFGLEGALVSGAAAFLTASYLMARRRRLRFERSRERSKGTDEVMAL